jgi:hypothetical protein
MRQWRIELTKQNAPISSNARPYWVKLREEHKRLRWDARVLTIAAAGTAPGVTAVRIELLVHPPNRAPRDSDNLVAHLLKPIKDGIADALRLEDDTDERVDWLRPRLGHPTNIPRRWRYVVTITELEAA